MTILLTKLDALVELARAAVERGDLITAAAHVEQLRDVLLRNDNDAPSRGPSVWERLKRNPYGE